MKMIQDKCENFAMLCYLKNRDFIKTTRESNKLILYLSYCSDYPEQQTIDGDFSEIQDKKIGIIVDNNFKLDYEDDMYSDYDERINKAYEHFKDKWFILQPKFSYSDYGNHLYVNGYNVRMKDQISDDQIDYIDGDKTVTGKYVRIPFFRPTNKIDYNRPQNIDQFEDALKKGKVVGDVYPWIEDDNQAPVSILWIDNSITMYTNIGIQTKSKNGFSYDSYSEDVNNDEIKKFSFNDNNLLKNLIMVDNDDVYNNLAFIPYDVFDKYDKLSTKFDLEDTYDILNEKKAFPIKNNDDSNDLDNTYFIESFKNEAEKNGLHYNFKDLINFHTSMESNGMVILSGLSGTGKSKLIYSYASTLGLYKDESKHNVCFIPVRPFWNDDSDLLGYADTMNNVYRAGDNGLVETLLEAESNPDSLYVIVFDEMNLARVEHYFSQFLSVLEMPSDKRFIQLYNDNLENMLYNSGKYRSKIKIGDNVLFVGTVNTDESTFKFSDKVLDRSNVITLNVQPFYEEINNKTFDGNDNDIWTYKDYRNLSKSNNNKLTTDEKRLLWDIHVSMNNCDKNLGIGWRTVNQIEDFINCLPNIEDGISKSEAIDLQIVQKVLTKIRGSEDELKDLIISNDGDIDDFSDNGIEKIEDILDRYKQISNFKKSKSIISQKAKELKIYGFTM